MTSLAHSVPVPSQLADDAMSFTRDFARRFCDEVARPMFSAPSVEAFEAELPDLLVHGAALRARWIAKLVAAGRDLAEPPARQLAPSAHAQAHMRARARALLGEVESFKLLRALDVTLNDVIPRTDDLLQRFHERLQLEGYELWLLHLLARQMEICAPQEVLAVGWLAVLYGDAPEPAAEVADAAAALLLKFTAARLQLLQDLLADVHVLTDLPYDESALAASFVAAHPDLTLPAHLMFGFVLDTPEVVAVSVSSRRDREDPDLEFLECRLHINGEVGEVLDRFESRLLASGVAGLQSDGIGGVLILTGVRA